MALAFSMQAEISTTAYYISGSAIGLSFINYLLQILGII